MRVDGPSEDPGTSRADVGSAIHLTAGAGSDPLRVLQLAIDSTFVGVAVCHRSGTILFANARTNAILGYSASDLLGRPLDAIVPHALAAVPAARRLDGIHRDGRLVPLDLSTRAAGSGGDSLVIVSLVDASERCALEGRLLCAEERTRTQRIAVDAASRFVDARLDQIDGVIVASLTEMSAAHGFDLAALFVDANESGTFLSSHGAVRDHGGAWTAVSTATALAWMMTRSWDGDTVAVTNLDAAPESVDRESMRTLGLRSAVVYPLRFGGVLRGALVFGATVDRGWPLETIEGLRLVTSVIGQAVARVLEREALTGSLGEMRRLRDRAAAENALLRRGAAARRASAAVVTDSSAIRRVLAQVAQVAPTTSTVLLQGETGSGKEVIAQTIHDQSPRRHRPMVRVSCAAIPSALIESELFGRERGAYTGALARQIGRFELAQGSTLFLDEIGELPVEVQVKLLRVLQERTIERLGGNESIKVDVRIVAATNRILDDAVRGGTFREDLFYRLNVFPIVVPPLRERLDDIPELVWTFVDEFSRAFGKPIKSITKESMAALRKYAWPGNIRELRNVVEREMIVATGSTLSIAVPRPPSSRPVNSTRLADVECDHIRAVLESCRWRVRGKEGAADRLGLKPTTLESRMARLGIRRDVRAIET